MRNWGWVLLAALVTAGCAPLKKKMGPIFTHGMIVDRDAAGFADCQHRDLRRGWIRIDYVGTIYQEFIIEHEQAHIEQMNTYGCALWYLLLEDPRWREQIELEADSIARVRVAAKK